MWSIKRCALVVVSAVASFSALPIFAAVSAPTGPYFEANVGTSQQTGITYAPSTTTDSANGWAWNLNLGYKFIPYFGGEIGYTSYVDDKINFNGTQVAKASSYSYDIAGKAILPFQDSGFEAFVKLGFARAFTNVKIYDAAVVAANSLDVSTGNHNSDDLYYGLGASYAWTPNVSFNFQWQRASDSSGKTGDLDLYSLGITYIMGSKSDAC